MLDRDIRASFVRYWKFGSAPHYYSTVLCKINDKQIVPEKTLLMLVLSFFISDLPTLFSFSAHQRVME